MPEGQQFTVESFGDNLTLGLSKKIYRDRVVLLHEVCDQSRY